MTLVKERGDREMGMGRWGDPNPKSNVARANDKERSLLPKRWNRLWLLPLPT